jgi:hypothetical protein
LVSHPNAASLLRTAHISLLLGTGGVTVLIS